MTVDFLRSRHSVRSFTPEPLSQEAVRGLKAEITIQRIQGKLRYVQGCQELCGGGR